MTEPIINPAAEADLAEALAYLAERSEPAAARLERDFLAAARVRAANPRSGRPRDDLRPGLRSFVVHKYVVFFIPVEGTIEVLRVIHGSRDLPAVFGGDHPGG